MYGVPVGACVVPVVPVLFLWSHPVLIIFNINLVVAWSIDRFLYEYGHNGFLVEGAIGLSV